jgi:hypothetical protein
MNATTPLWVPLAVAAGGLITTIGAAVLTGWWASHREDVRWAREREDRLAQWQREDSQRWLQDRRQAYARLLTALNELSDKLEDARQIRAMDVEAELDLAEIKSAVRVIGAALSSVQIIASKEVASRAPFALGSYAPFVLWLSPSAKLSLAKIEELLETAHNRTEWLYEAMRKDLGLEVPNLLETLKGDVEKRADERPNRS